MTALLSKYKRHKILFTFLLVVLGIVLIFALIVNQYWSPILAKKVKNIVLTSSDSLYTIDFSDAKLHVLKGEIDIYNITLKPDTAVYNRRLKNHVAPNNLIELRVKRLVLSHIHPFNLYFHHKLDIEQVTLREPTIKLSYQLNHTKDTVIKDRRTTWQKISKALQSIHIGQIALNDVKLKYEDYSGNKVDVSELKELNFSATDLLIDSATQTDKSRTLYCKDISTELNNYTGHTPDKLYSYNIRYMSLSTQARKLIIQGLDLRPVNLDTFLKTTKQDCFTIHLDTIQFNRFDFALYQKYRILNTSNIKLSHGSLEVINNANKPLDSNNVKTFPNYLLQHLKSEVNIDTIQANHIDVAYSETGKKSHKSGTVTFNKASGTFLNVTNNKLALQQNNICTAKLSSYFMNRGKLDAFFTFNLTDSNLSYSYKGNLGAMDIKSVNTAIMPLALVKVNTGKLKELTFDIKADNRHSRGSVTLLYNNLKVTVLKADSITQRLKRLTIASLFANIMILKHDNPDSPNQEPRVSSVNYIRPNNFAFFKTIWHTLLTGIKPSVGLNETMQQNVKTKIADMARKKEERKIKKAIRQQRRAERQRKRALKKQEKALNQ